MTDTYHSRTIVDDELGGRFKRKAPTEGGCANEDGEEVMSKVPDRQSEPLSPLAKEIFDKLMAKTEELKAARKTREARERTIRERPAAEVLQWPKPLSQVELFRRQQIIEQTWERVIAERRALDEAEEAEQPLHQFVWGKQ